MLSISGGRRKILCRDATMAQRRLLISCWRLDLNFRRLPKPPSVSSDF
jgi:hypothetical protein